MPGEPAIHSPGPAFVKIEYQSPYAPHVCMIPTKAYEPGGAPFTPGDFTAWDGTTVLPADTMVEDFIDLLAACHGDDTQFTGYTIFQQEDPDTPAVPVYSKSIAVPGLIVLPAGWDKATQLTMTFRTTAFGIAKLVMLDIPTSDTFGKVIDLTPFANFQAVSDAFTANDQAWSGRDGARPAVFLQYAVDLNDKLRKLYRMN